MPMKATPRGRVQNCFIELLIEPHQCRLHYLPSALVENFLQMVMEAHFPVFSIPDREDAVLFLNSLNALVGLGYRFQTEYSLGEGELHSGIF